MEEMNYQSTPMWLVYIGRILILSGMVLVFGGVGVLVSSLICQQIYGIDLSSLNFDAIGKEDVNTIASLKIIQTFGGGIGMFLIPSLLFPKVIHYQVSTMIAYRYAPKPWTIGVAVLLVFVSIPAIAWLFQINQQLSFPEAFSWFETKIRDMESSAAALTKVFVSAETIPMLLLNLLVVALVPAVCEEFFFRGILQQYTRYIFDRPWIAITVSALVFSGFHGQFYGFLPRFAWGLLLGHLYNITGNIFVPIAAHFLNNAMAVLMSYFEKDLSAMVVFEETYVFDWYWVVLSLAATLGLAWFLKYYTHKRLYGFHVKFNADGTMTKLKR